MAKSGLLVLLANIILKLIVGLGLWRMAMAYNASNSVNQEIFVQAEPPVMENEPQQQERIFPIANRQEKIQIRSDSSNGDV